MAGAATCVTVASRMFMASAASRTASAAHLVVVTCMPARLERTWDPFHPSGRHWTRSSMPGDIDRGLIHALHLDARAPFSRVGAVLGVSTQTVARSYQRRRAEAKRPSRVDSAVVATSLVPGRAHSRPARQRAAEDWGSRRAGAVRVDGGHDAVADVAEFADLR